MHLQHHEQHKVNTRICRRLAGRRLILLACLLTFSCTPALPALQGANPTTGASTRLPDMHTATSSAIPSGTPTPTATSTPQPTATPTHTPSATPTITATPTFTPSATLSAPFEVTSISQTAHTGDHAHAAIRTLPGAACAISYITPSGRVSTAKGLDAKTAGDDGRCAWTWMIGTSTRPGTGRITINANDHRLSFNIEIVK